MFPLCHVRQRHTFFYNITPRRGGSIAAARFRVPFARRDRRFVTAAARLAQANDSRPKAGRRERLPPTAESAGRPLFPLPTLRSSRRGLPPAAGPDSIQKAGALCNKGAGP